MKSLIIIIALAFLFFNASGQVASKDSMDTTNFAHRGKVSVEGYIDSYYAYNFNKPTGKDQPYFVSMARDREVNINLAYVGVKYTSSRIRARFAPGVGTYMNSNYAAEAGTLKHIVEGTVGVRISPRKNIWIDAGVFGSPYTNESAISKDHLAYTRSFAPEYVPYYLAGVKLSAPLGSQVTAYLYVLNGWQQIQDQNDKLSLGTQLEYRPTQHLLLNWNTYIGDERSASDTTVGPRFFNDLYLVYTKGRFSATSCVYLGVQRQAERVNGYWWQANFIARYHLTDKFSVTGRIEHFSDPKSVQIVPIDGSKGFSTSSSSLGVNYQVAENLLLRLEGRTFFSDKEVYSRNSAFVKNSSTITSNITIWF